MPSVMKKSGGNKENVESVDKQVPVTKDSNNVNPESADDNDPFNLITAAIEKKIRNLDKRKQKLESYDNDLRKGKELTEDQKDAVARLGVVFGQLEVIKELQKNVYDIVKQHKKEVKQAEKARGREKQATETNQFKEYIRLQELLNELDGGEARDKGMKMTPDGLQPVTEADLKLCDKLYELLAPTHTDCDNVEEWEARLEQSALHTFNFMTKSTKKFDDTNVTYKEARALLDAILKGGYFEGRISERAGSPPDNQAKSEVSTESSTEEQTTQVQLGVGHSSSIGGVENGGGTVNRDSPSAIVGHGKLTFLQDDQTGERPQLLVDTGHQLYNNSSMQPQQQQQPQLHNTYGNGGQVLYDPPPPIPLPHQASPSTLDPHAAGFVPKIQAEATGDHSEEGNQNMPGGNAGQDGPPKWHGRGGRGGGRGYGGGRPFRGGRGGPYRGAGGPFQPRGRGPYRGRGGGGGYRGGPPRGGGPGGYSE